MGSPLVFGGFNGWTVVGDRLSYTVGRAEYDDFLVRGSLAAADAVLTTGVLTGAFSVGDPSAPEAGPFNLEQFVILGDTMGSHLIDVTSEAFTGAVVAAEGQYRGGEYNTFISSGTGDYPATEIDFRFGYWIGVPMFKGEKT